MDQLIDLKAYIASTAVLVPVIVAIIAAAASIICVVVRAQLKRHRFCQQICLTSARGFDTRQHRDWSRSSTARMTHSGKPCDEPGEHRRRGYCTGLAASSVNHRRRTTTCVTLTFNVIPALGERLLPRKGKSRSPRRSEAAEATVLYPPRTP